MKQEGLLQFVFLFIFIFLITIFIGSSINRFSLADVNNVTTTTSSIHTINITSSSGADVWLSQSFLITITGSNINKTIILKFSDSDGNITIRQIDCANGSQNTCSSSTLAPLAGKSGIWAVVAYIDSIELMRKEFVVKSVCGTANGGSFAVIKTGSGNWCQNTTTGNNLNLCNSPASIANADMYPTTTTSTDNKCIWNCSYGNIIENCYFNYTSENTTTTTTTTTNLCASIDPVYTLESSNNLCSGGAVADFVPTDSGWTWHCVFGGVSLECSAKKKINGACNAIADSDVASPIANLCTAGTAINFTGSGPWTWICSGINGGTDSGTCFVKKKSITNIILDSSKVTINPASAVIGSSVSVRVEVDASLANAESLNLVSKPILSSLSNQLSVVLKKCSSGGDAFCGTFTAPDIAGEWSVLLYSSDNTNIQISSLKTFVVVSNDQMPIIGTPIITPSIINPGDEITVKLPVQNSTSVKSIKVSFGPQDKDFNLSNTISSVCSEDASSWCAKIVIPSRYSGGNWNLSVVSYINNLGTEKIISSTLKSSFVIRANCNHKYSDWGKCIDKKQTRTILERDTSDCFDLQEELTRACVTCEYTYSNWSSCQNGKRYRTVLSGFSEGCSEGEKITEENCTVVNCTAYVYSDWSSCQNGKRTRKLISASPSGCLGNSILEEVCNETESSCSEDKWECEPWGLCTKDNNQSRKCSIIFDCPFVTNSTPELTKFCNFSSSGAVVQDNNNTLVVSTNSDLSAECVRENISDVTTCQAYISQINIVSECLANKINTYDKCKEYLLNKYPQPVKCQGLKTGECDTYIRDVLLADLKSNISSETKEKLVSSVGGVATINAENKIIKVVNSSGVSSDLKVDNIPLASSNTNVAVNLVPIENKNNEEYLSPVAITFDSNSNGIPDDMENRLGADYKKDELTGVDKAIAEGKALEQPKFKSESLISGSLTIEQVRNSDNAGIIKFQGKAAPDKLLTLFIYSTMPIVITVKSDSNGNWVYELDKSLINGKHEAYIVVNNSEGRIVEASLPKPFFIDEARAVALEEFIRMEDAASVSVSESSDGFIRTYVAAGVGFIALLIILFLFIRSKAEKQENR
ncbi:MAG: hypothetical protein PHR47_00285 [Candidatus Pacebacteria bacterium]|nr:hypothetical protein [Candidatus Paceibacterota bacterium]